MATRRSKKISPAPLEKAVVAQILDYLRLRRIFAWRNNTGGVVDARGHFYRYGAVGSPDIIGVLGKNGRFLAIEVKREGQRPSARQTAFLGQLRAFGALVVVAYNLEDVQKALSEGGEDKC